MNWYLVFFVAVRLVGLGIVLSKDGESKIGERYRFWPSLIVVAFEVWLVVEAIRCGWPA